MSRLRGWVLIALLAAVPLAAGRYDRVPTDPEALNELVKQYNRYVGQLKAGVVDIKQWRKVEKAWEGLK